MRKSEEKLRILCPSYEGSLGKNDFYRLENALRYAIASKGKLFSYKKDEKLKDDFFAERQNLKIFTYKERQNLAKLINKRCVMLMENGMLEEYFEFNDRKDEIKDLDKTCLPIGYKDLDEFFKKWEGGLSWFEREDGIMEMWASFAASTRRYAKYQNSYQRSKLKDFRTVSTDQFDPDFISDAIISYLIDEDETAFDSIDGFENSKNDQYKITEKEYWDLIVKLDQEFKTVRF